MSKSGAKQWTPREAHAWHARQKWLVGCNFTPSYAINQLEMWQAETFDLALIDRELGLAASIGMNCARIYLHDLLWLQDAPGFVARIDAVLAAAQAHGIRVMLVLFDSCWDPTPALGPQKAPRPGVHNSGWVQSPGVPALSDAAEHARLEDYVRGVVSHFAGDERVLAWDVWNEPDNGPEVASCDALQHAAKSLLVIPLLNAAFGWARAAGSTQPLTSGIWFGDWSAPDMLTPIQVTQTGNSDIVSFHNYGTPDDFEQRVLWLKRFGRPLLCTEFMARPCGSTFEGILPAAKEHGVGAFCWGLVKGKTQTHLPWDSWAKPYVDGPTGPWFHDVFDADHSPYDADEVAMIRRLAA